MADWIDSPLVSLPGIDPISGKEIDNMILASVGYVGELDGSLPSRGVPPAFFCGGLGFSQYGNWLHWPSYSGVSECASAIVSRHFCVTHGEIIRTI